MPPMARSSSLLFIMYQRMTIKDSDFASYSRTLNSNHHWVHKEDVGNTLRKRSGEEDTEEGQSLEPLSDG